MPRKKGTPNKITRDVRELLLEIVEGQMDDVKETLGEMKKTDKKTYLKIFVALLPYVAPKCVHQVTEINMPAKAPSWFDYSINEESAA